MSGGFLTGGWLCLCPCSRPGPARATCRSTRRFSPRREAASAGAVPHQRGGRAVHLPQKHRRGAEHEEGKGLRRTQRWPLKASLLLGRQPLESLQSDASEPRQGSGPGSGSLPVLQLSSLALPWCLLLQRVGMLGHPLPRQGYRGSRDLSSLLMTASALLHSSRPGSAARADSLHVLLEQRADLGR